MKKLILIATALFVLGPATVMASAWKVDPPHSSIRFEIKHIYATVSGRFADFSGQVLFDPASPGKSKFDFTVKVDSINTGNAKRDNHLRSPDFFDATKYPEMVFESTRVQKKDDHTYVLEGNMTVKDVTKDVKLEMTYWGQKQNPLDKKVMVSGFDIRFKIDRLGYHVGGGKFFKMGVVGKEVSVFISLEMIRKK